MRERRQETRKQLEVPVKVRVKNGDGPELTATTRDLSSNGVFLYSESALQVGAKLELVLMLPPDLGVGPGGWTLCQASVVRVETSDGTRVGVAATLDRIDLLPQLS